MRLISSLGITAIILLSIVFRGADSFAAPGDTTTVQTFTFGSPLEGKFLFPDSTHRWSRILMEYTLKCNPAQFPQCGEWDYLTYTYLFKHTGQYDSTLYSFPNFKIDGATPDSLMVMNSVSWKYNPWFEYFNQTVPVVAGTIGDSSIAGSNIIFSANGHDSRTQILWKAQELADAGLHIGYFTGMRFKVLAPGSPLKKLVIRMKNSSLDSLAPQVWETAGMTEVIKRDFRFTGTGWQTIPFTFPFEWDGFSNIVADISYEQQVTDEESLIYAGSALNRVIRSEPASAYSLNFRDLDYVEVPADAFSAIDSAITICFWQYGDPVLQPESSCILEGIDTAGQRVLNIHLPWSDGQIYWDAGRDSNGYDRINKASGNSNIYKGKWNHWAFTKDLKTGRMVIYHNGQLWYLGSSKFKRMKGVDRFKIGSNGLGTDNYYDGMVDEFMIWDKALSDTAIKEIMYRKVGSDFPDFSHLALYYRFNDGTGFIAGDSSAYHHPGRLVGYPEWQSYNGVDRFQDFSNINESPTVVFEQGNYDPAAVDSVLRVDTIAKTPVMIVFYGDSIHPTSPTDTITRYPGWYNNYVYNSQGVAVDSSLVTPDSILYRKDHHYYGPPFEVTYRYELARYITPYGNNLTLGNGFTWVFDLTDYAPLLRDSVHLSSGNWQELLDMKFRMIEGIPPRDVIGIKNIYTGTHGYANADQHNLPPVKVMIDPGVANARLKMRITGHGFGGTLDCSEFCPRTNKLFVNGNLAYTHYVWRPDCTMNPLYPQGGTWLYPRAEWCPGAEVRTKDFELSQFIVPGDSLTVDYDLQEGYTWNNQGSWPYYAIESQMITYSAPNFSLDAAIEEVLAPNKNDIYKRYNPMCGNPVIRIRNNGSIALTTADITYGPLGGRMQVYHWTGNLAFTDSATVILPSIDWNDWTGGDNRFTFTISAPNGGVDQYPQNNTMISAFAIPPTFDNMMIVHMLTNHQGYAQSWYLTDQDGNVLYHRDTLETNTLYTDTVQLQKGCYRLTINNKEGEGLHYWANMPPYGNGTAGWADIRKITGQMILGIQADFGLSTSLSFTVGMTIDIPDLNPVGYVNVYPNPGDGHFNVACVFDEMQTVTMTVADCFGKEVYGRIFNNILKSTLPVELPQAVPGVYLLKVSSAIGTTTRKIIITR